MAFRPLGILESTGLPLFDSITPTAFATAFLPTIDRRQNVSVTRNLNMDVINDHYDNPKNAGWRIIAHPEDWHLLMESMGAEIRMLSELRTGRADREPLWYDCQTPSLLAWSNWLEKHYEPLRGIKSSPPYYLLILGSPERVPFGFQALLGLFAAVGRVCFDNLEDYRSYFNKVIAADSSRRDSQPRLNVFAPCHDETTATTVAQLAEPTLAWARKKNIACLETTDKKGGEKKATKENFLDSLRRETGVLLSIGHGFFSDRDDHAAFNGAVVCPPVDRAIVDKDTDLVAARDLSADLPCLEGGIFYQYACFGLGTPIQSTVDHWLVGRSSRMGREELVSALPKSMLAHSKGPLAYVGHLDVALVMDPQENAGLGNPLEPMHWILESLIHHNRTLGHAMQRMRHEILRMNNHVTATLDEQEKRRRDGFLGFLEGLGPESKVAFLEAMLRLIDTRHFMVLGDPAVRLGWVA